ncbi:hypothetical protein R1A27_32800 (plasmid) [Methylobacterium sp. NMS12]|uniref:hypothetical protein n=1 Tax=Methylobacterium sp. NMS12 TaxID=3079766 RepID=UPI003F88253A
MAEVQFLPVRTDHDGAGRLAAALTEMIEAGGDPGPRDAQIRGLGLSLEALVQALRAELTSLGVGEDLEGPMATLDRMAGLASSYQADAFG